MRKFLEGGRDGINSKWKTWYRNNVDTSCILVIEKRFFFCHGYLFCDILNHTHNIVHFDTMLVS